MSYQIFLVLDCEFNRKNGMAKAAGQYFYTPPSYVHVMPVDRQDLPADKLVWKNLEEFRANKDNN